jgi:hypothetical protein
MRSVLRFFGNFANNASGSVLNVFALSLGPTMMLMGAAVEYSRASDDRAGLQRALDAAILMGAKDGTSQWITVATSTFRSAFQSKSGAAATPQFSSSGNRYAAAVATSSSTALLTPIGVQAIPISASATALVTPADNDSSCLLTLGRNQALATNSMTFSGVPSVVLNGCSIRSNTSLNCNGHGTSAMASISAGTTNGCNNPISGASVVGDIYRPLASNITRKCSSANGNVSWSPGNPPASNKMVTVLAYDRTEYHICGDLTLSGSGSLTGAYPSSDTIIVVENGSLTLARDAAISATRTAIVLTGNNPTASAINFPNGAGQVATLTLSPPTTRSDPWAGIAIYQDPALTNVSEDWGPGATLTVDGVVYLPNADVTLRGNMGSSSSGCPKVVTNTLTVGGDVNLTHTGQACSSLNVQQWAQPRSPVLVQ